MQSARKNVIEIDIVLIYVIALFTMGNIDIPLTKYLLYQGPGQSQNRLCQTLPSMIAHSAVQSATPQQYLIQSSSFDNLEAIFGSDC